MVFAPGLVPGGPRVKVRLASSPVFDFAAGRDDKPFFGRLFGFLFHKRFLRLADETYVRQPRISTFIGRKAEEVRSYTKTNSYFLCDRVYHSYLPLTAKTELHECCITGSRTGFGNDGRQAIGRATDGVFHVGAAGDLLDEFLDFFLG